jgi:hypothetical protein
MRKRRLAIAVAAVVLVAGVVAGRERPSLEIIQPRAAAVAAADDDIDLGKLQRGESSLPRTDPFKEFSIPKKSPEGKVAVEKPTAPPLPFKYFGRLTENGKSEIYVMRDQDLLTVVPGLNLGDYRVDQVGENQISFTYLPLKTKQTLDIPAVN